MARVLFQRAASGYRPVRGELIRRVQVALRDAGSDPRGIDGILGRDAESAVRDFQLRTGLAGTGNVTDDTWTRLMNAPSPAAFDRCLQLTAAFEGHGFDKVVGNFDGAGLTWGIIGFTLLHGELQAILNEVKSRYPRLLRRAFGSLAPTLRDVLAMSRTKQLDWANSVSLGSQRYRVDPAWEQAFAVLGRFPDVQAIQLRRVARYWDIAMRDTERFELDTELGVALCFDIAVQNGGIDADVEERRIRQWLADNPGVSERDRRVRIADVVADNSRPQYVEDVRRRKRAIATGDGEVHGARYAVRDWGLTEAPWRT
jgi:hypothetical protein